MKILFVSGGNRFQGNAPVVNTQGDSLAKHSADISYFLIIGRGWRGYLKNTFKLRQYLRKHEVDIMHAHFCYSGWVCTIANPFVPVLVSLMGDDVRGKVLARINFFFARFFWRHTIVKSQIMFDRLGYPKAEIIANGVDFEKFRPVAQEEAKKALGWSTTKKHIIFVCVDRTWPVKNLALAEKAVALLDDPQVEFLVIEKAAHETIYLYMNAADVLLMTSLSEGSPNVIKEAMACNCPIVATDVGDIKEVIGKTEGCFITGIDAEDVAQKLRLALDFGGRTIGREHIKHLDINTVAKRIISIYERMYKHTRPANP